MMARRGAGEGSAADDEYTDPWDRPVSKRARWLTVHNLYRGGAIAVTLVVAAFAVTNWWQGAWNQIAPNERVYAQLTQLSAGMSVRAFERVLGPASIENTKEVTQPRPYPAAPVTESFAMRIYMKDQFVVTTLSTADERTVLYSVLSCNEQFEPSFITPEKSTVRLRTAPIAEANVPHVRSTSSASTASGTASPEPTWESHVLYQTGSTGSSPGIYVEIPISVPDGHSHERTYGYGVNEACGDITVTTDSGARVTDYNVPTVPGAADAYSHDEATTALARYRQRTEPNFYYETANGFSPPRTLTGTPGADDESLIAQTFAIISPNDDEFPARYAVEELGQ